MTLNTPPEDGSPIDEAMEEVLEDLRHLRKELRKLRKHVEDGGDDAANAVVRSALELNRSIRETRRMEAEIEERQKQREGRVNDYALDLAEARSRIGCRLSRLRRCRGMGTVS